MVFWGWLYFRGFSNFGLGFFGALVWVYLCVFDFWVSCFDFGAGIGFDVVIWVLFPVSVFAIYRFAIFGVGLLV